MSNTTSPIKVSVIVPVYNVSKYIGRCIESILNQTLKEIELICIDDCTPDDSGKIIDRYANSDSRVRVIHKSVNQGPMVARKDGYTAARGEYICFCDGDDLMPANALADLYQAAISNNVDLVIGNLQLVSETNFGPCRRDLSSFDSNWESYLRFMLHWGTASLCGALFRRELFTDTEYTAVVGMKQSEDRRLFTEILILKRPTICKLDKVVYYYWINPKSTTRTKINNDSVKSQFESLYGSYDFIESHTDKFTRDNDNQMVNFLSYYIEAGVSASLLKDIHPHNRHLLRFSVMKNISGLTTAIHTSMCIHIPGYRPMMHGIRNLIRRMQHKD